MRRNRILCLCVCALCLPWLTACRDSREIDETGYVIALGIDKGETDDSLRYTFQFSNPLGMGGGDEGEEKKSEDGSGKKEDENTSVSNITVEASDYYIAGNMLNSFMSKRPNLSHVKLIVFSEELAREGISKQAQLLMQEREIRPNTNLAVARNGAGAFLKSVNPKLEESTAKYYELLLKEENTPYAPMVELREFTNSIGGEARSPVLPLADMEQSKVAGMAVFSGKKMVGVMGDSDAMLYRILCGDAENAFLTVPDLYEKNKEITLQVWTSEKPKYKVNLSGGVPKIYVDVELNANCVGVQLSKEYKDYGSAESRTARFLEEEFGGFFDRAQREYGVDVLGFGSAAKRQCLTWDQWEKLDWNECFRRAEIETNVHLKIRRSGTTLPLAIE